MDEPAKRVRSSENFFVKEQFEKKVTMLLKSHNLDRPSRSIHDILSKATQQFLGRMLQETSSLVKSRRQKSTRKTFVSRHPREALDEWREEHKQRREEFEASNEVRTKRRRDDYDKDEEHNDLIMMDLKRKTEQLNEESVEPVDFVYRVTERDVRYQILMDSYKFKT